MPGLRRVKRGSGFDYLLPDGRRLRNKAQLERIRHLAIPPAYTDVWICPLPNGHLQAHGRDARGRKQYRYHAEWRAARDADKFARMAEFGRALPRIRKHVAADLALRKGEQPDRAAVLAALVRLLDTTLVRIGNDEYTRANRSYGLTTLRNRHAAVQGSTLELRFRGKGGVEHRVALDDPRVARIVRRCQALPGQSLFEYEDEDDDGSVRSVGSVDVNDYLREAAGAEFTAKDFRTWHATVLALALAREPGPDGRRRGAREVLTEVAALLRNTVAVCRKSYVHPEVLALCGQEVQARPMRRRRAGGLSGDERELLAFLRRLQRKAKQPLVRVLEKSLQQVRKAPSRARGADGSRASAARPAVH
ncbi:MAG TPA: DNA topoisomerase IB [Albitalea sp.]|nr:DNA topoisomerase IB [Albitalea sp.]